MTARIFHARPCMGAILAGLALASPVAAAQEAESVYTRIENCPSYQYPDEPVWETACAGHDTYSLYLMSSEHSSAIAYAFDGGPRSDFMRVPANAPYSNFHDVVEWRLHAGTAVATIHRSIAFTPGGLEGSDAEQQETLVVTALAPGSDAVACQIAFLDASAMSDANEAARLVADTFAPSWSCDGADPMRFDALDQVYMSVEAFDGQSRDD